jgi:transglutaminase-like putative cysteine protease
LVTWPNAIAAQPPAAIAVAIEQYLSRSYRDSLDVGPVLEGHSIEAFLVERKTGHFATAMVVVLRTLGVPPVSGPVSRRAQWTVRQRNAHAWVEVYVPPHVWLAFDMFIWPARADTDRLDG